MKKSSFSESEHSSNYFLSLTQLSKSESCESVKFIEKSYPRVAQCRTCQSYCKRRQLASFQIYPEVLYNLVLVHCTFSLGLCNCWQLWSQKFCEIICIVHSQFLKKYLACKFLIVIKIFKSNKIRKACRIISNKFTLTCLALCKSY